MLLNITIEKKEQKISRVPFSGIIQLVFSGPSLLSQKFERRLSRNGMNECRSICKQKRGRNLSS